MRVSPGRAVDVGVAVVLDGTLGLIVPPFEPEGAVTADEGEANAACVEAGVGLLNGWVPPGGGAEESARAVSGGRVPSIASISGPAALVGLAGAQALSQVETTKTKAANRDRGRRDGMKGVVICVWSYGVFSGGLGFTSILTLLLSMRLPALS